MKSLIAVGTVLYGLAAAVDIRSDGLLPVIDLGYELHQAAFLNVRIQ